MATYAGQPDRRLPAAEHPHRPSRAPRRHALRRLPALPVPVRLRDARGRPARSPRTACAAPRRSSTSSPCTLDHERGGEIAGRLQGIYVFCRRHLIEARIERDPDKIDEVSELLAELREAWAEIAGA